ncbi:O-antigen ligase family protein [Psychrobacillus sp. NPDC058041]|uniref:O-antigen ligase family protein n=1 Tax=Psychrobacillus sp. NPDC058041 TaxID=3346310 RepID=UPI0036D92574
MVVIFRVKVVFSVEFLYIMFLFSGAFKESLNAPFDLAAIFLGLVLLKVVWGIIKRPVIKKSLIIPGALVISLLFLMLTSTMITGLTDSSIEKVIKFVFLTMPTFLLPFIIIKNKESIQKVLLSVSILSIVLSLFAFPMIINRTGLFVGFNNGNYQGLARTTGIGFIALAYFYLTAKKKVKLFVLPFLIIVSVTLISTGSRIPLIAIGAIGIYALINSFVIKKSDVLIKKNSIAGLTLAAVFIIVIPFLFSKGYFQTIVYRFKVLFEDNGGGASTLGRVDRIQSAIEMFKENIIFGGGIGKFGQFYIGTEGVYAHNIFLEFISELGLIGVLWLMVFLTFVLYHSVIQYKRANRYLDSLQIALISGFLFFFINALVSGDINANRALFAFGGFLAMSPYLKSEVKKASSKIAMQ